jgi:acyl carrier protein
MAHEDLEREVRQLLLSILKLGESPAEDLQRDDIEQWDSLKHVEIVFALEDEYDVQFDESEFGAMNSVSAITALLRARLGA